MLWRVKQNLAQKILAQVYKIQPKLLSADNHQAWTNLGYWQTDSSNQRLGCVHNCHAQDYVQAARQLAQQMGQSLNLTAQDNLLDIGCGYGASLALWHQQFGVQKMAALELQAICCNHLHQQKISYLDDIFQQSCFDSQPKQLQKYYDVIVSIDATYHYCLQDYLNAIDTWLASSGRVGFHLLIKSTQWQQASSSKQKILSKKLKWVKVDIDHVLSEVGVVHTLEKQGYEQIEIKNLTQQVLQGFADFIQYKSWGQHEKWSIGFLKIYFTAKLCRTLAQSELLQYVQITAKKKANH